MTTIKELCEHWGLDEADVAEASARLDEKIANATRLRRLGRLAYPSGIPWPAHLLRAARIQEEEDGDR